MISSPPELVFDHLAVGCRSLEEGGAHIQQQIGLTIPPGGAHPLMGTHNRLMALGPTAFLEAISVDPHAPDPGRPRWFALDAFETSPKIATWVLGTSDVRAALSCLQARMPGIDLGRPIEVTRDHLVWHLSVPDDGSMPLGGAFPALIEWSGISHPAERMTDLGARLVSMTITHPRANLIKEALQGLLSDDRFSFVCDEACGFHAVFETPDGERGLT